jgi:lipopolysaccharide biosynthesis glycosyltransferase
MYHMHEAVKQQRELDPLELVVVMYVLGTKPWTSESSKCP